MATVRLLKCALCRAGVAVACVERMALFGGHVAARAFHAGGRAAARHRPLTCHVALGFPAAARMRIGAATRSRWFNRPWRCLTFPIVAWTLHAAVLWRNDACARLRSATGSATRRARDVGARWTRLSGRIVSGYPISCSCRFRSQTAGHSVDPPHDPYSASTAAVDVAQAGHVRRATAGLLASVIDPRLAALHSRPPYRCPIRVSQSGRLARLDPRAL